ncbi:MAG: DUF402 domain-containing protein [Armatimonadota bacterium]|nr:DUF402 domain-containing protein [Armatimonadota bacterium]MDW8156742.1 DUF402 domain-containing protein [Armatimonadota bacterium]
MKRRPGGAAVRFPCRLVDRTRSGAVLLYVLDQPWQVAGVTLRAGVATFAYYWVGRWYNVYHWLAPRGRTVAVYVNVATPARVRRTWVEWTDLGVDVLGLPGSPPRVLDAEDLEGLPDPLRDRARRSLRQVLGRWPQLVDSVERRTRRILARLNELRPAPGG